MDTNRPSGSQLISMNHKKIKMYPKDPKASKEIEMALMDPNGS